MAVVATVLAGGVEILTWDHRRVVAKVAGATRHRQQRVRLLVVGDVVHVDEKGDDMVIVERLERRRELRRVDERGNARVLAANLDLVAITVSCVRPVLKPGLIDRYLLSARAGGVEPVLLVNKFDLAAEEPDLEARLAPYVQIGVPVFRVSAANGEGFAALAERLGGQVVFVTGQSGVGKTSIIARLTGRDDLRVGQLIDETQKGRHTTTQSAIYPLADGGVWIDSPGIRAFALPPLSIDEIQAGFPEIDAERDHCRFRGCQHVVEPDCAVVAAVAAGRIAAARHESYRRLVEELKLPAWQRAKLAAAGDG